MEISKEEIECWLKLLTWNYTEQRRLSTLKEGEFEAIRTGPGVQLYCCTRKAAEIMGLPLREEIIRYEDGSKDKRVSFTYNHVEFYGLEKAE